MTLREQVEQRTPDLIRAYQVTFYHDEPGEAAADTFSWSKPYRSVAGAIRAARTCINSQWQSASIHRGIYHEATSKQPAYWELDERASVVRVGADWVER
jgi:hypothetical protein